MAVVLSVALPTGSPPPGGSFGLDGLSWLFSLRLAWGAVPAVSAVDPDTPEQGRGNPLDRHHRATRAETQANGGVGGPRGTAKGELAPDTPVVAPRPEPQRIPSGRFDPSTSRRDAARSSESTTFYQNADGSLTIAYASGRVNYRAADGSWQPIDTRLVERSDAAQQGRSAGPSRLESAANDVVVALAGGGAQRDTWQELASVTLPSGEVFAYGLAGARPVTPTVAGSVATYAGVLPDTDIEVTASATGLKEAIILRSANAATSWVFPLRLEGLTAAPAKDGSVRFANAAGEVVLRIPAGFMSDSRFDPRTGTMTTSSAVRYEMVKVDGEPALRVSVDEQWVRDPARQFPIRVDPTVTTAPATTDAFVDNDEATGASEQNGDDLAVGTNDDGSYIARSFIHFGGFNSTVPAGHTVLEATLRTYLSWTYDCEHPQAMQAYRVTTAWTDSELSTQGMPGPSVGTLMGTGVPVDNYPACTNTAADRSVGEWLEIDLAPATLNDWVADPGTNLGIALKAYVESGTDEFGAPSRYYFKRLTSTNFGSGQYGPQLVVTYVPNGPPYVHKVYPTSGFATGTLTPELGAVGGDDGSPSALKYQFFVYDGQPDSEGQHVEVARSGLTTFRRWRVPDATLAWGRSYLWRVLVNDGATSAYGPFSVLSVRVPQPLITGRLSQNPDGFGVSPAVGNYTAAAVDATVASVGPQLEISRSYNSRDPRTTGAFGAGWSSILDAEVRPADASSPPKLVTMRYPTGQEVTFGRNPDGTWDAGSGRFATLSGPGSGYQLVDKNATTFTFGKDLGGGRYGLSAVADAAGRALTLTYVSGRVERLTSTSGRALYVTWDTPSGSGVARVASVSTDRASPADPGSVSTWTYGYDGDQLTSVCPPTTPAQCHGYTYDAAETVSLHPAAVLDAAPRSYFRLGASTGAQLNAATDSLLVATAMPANVGSEAGPFAGTTAVTFDGTSSFVELVGEDAPLAGFDQTMSLWFKTPPGLTSGGVLFGAQSTPIGQLPTSWIPALYVGTDGKLHGKLKTSSTSALVSAITVNDGQWHHAVLTATLFSQTLYLDGAPVETTTETQQSHGTHLSHVYVGAGRWTLRPATSGDYGYFTGSIAEVALFDRPLTAADVATLYATGAAASRPLTTVTRPSGAVTASIDYDQVRGTVDALVDANGGTWTYDEPARSGSDLTYASAVLGNGPSNYWRLNQTGGGVTVNEVNGIEATLSGVTLGVPGPFAGMSSNPPTAAAFNGTDARVTSTEAPVDTTKPFSVSTWVKLNSESASQCVLTLKGTATYSFRLHYQSTNERWEASVNGRRSDGTHGWSTLAGPGSSVSTGTWTNVVATVDSPTGAMTLYVNGEQAAQKTTTGLAEIYQTTYGVSLGGPYGCTWLDGSLAEVATFRRALSADEVAAMYKAYHASRGAPVKTVRVTDPMGAQRSTVHDLLAGGRIISSTDTRGQTTVYGYDTGGFLRSVTDPNGNTTITGHDVRGNVVSRSTCQDQSANLCATEYYSHYPNNTAKTLTPDPRNDVVLTVRDGRSSGPTDNTYLTTYTYDAQGNQTAVTDALGRVTTTEYSSRPTPTASASCKSSEGPEKAFDGRWSGLDTKWCDATSSSKWLKAQFPGKRTISQITIRHAEAGGEQVGYNTKDFDLLTSNDGSAWTTVAQVRGNSAAVTTQNFNPALTTKYVKLLIITPANNGNPAARIYEIEFTGSAVTIPGLPLTETTAGGAQRRLEYYPTGDLLRSVDAAGKRAESSYDGLGRLIASTEITDSYPTGLVTQYEYEKDGLLSTITAPPVLNRVTGATHTAKVTVWYNADRQETKRRIEDLTGGDALRETERGYNALGQLQWVSDAEGRREYYTYDARGNRVTVTPADAGGNPLSHTVAQTYDGERHLLTTKVLNYGGPGQHLPLESRDYDPAGRLARVVDAMGWETRYTYTDNNLPATTTRHDTASGHSHLVESNSYDKAGFRTRTVSANGTLTTDYAVDKVGRTVSQTVDPAGVNRTTAYTYDRDDHVLSTVVSDGTGATERTDALYDQAGRRLAQTAYPNGTATPVGRWKLDETSGSIAADASGNSPATVGSGASWSSDHGGSMTFNGTGGGLLTAGPVLDTTRSYTVTAWVKLNASPANNKTAVSQDGSYRAAFLLGYDKNNNKWKMKAAPPDYLGPLYQTYSTSTITTGTWTHLAGVYDEQAAKLRLYVNGAFQSEITVPDPPVGATGPLRIGAVNWEGGSINDKWTGSIDDVQVYQTALTNTQVAAVYNGSAPAAGSAVIRTRYTYDQRGLALTTTDPNGATTYTDYDEAGRAVVTTSPSVLAEEHGTTAVQAPAVNMLGYNTFGEKTETRDAKGRVVVTAYNAAGQPVATIMPHYTPPGGATISGAQSTVEYDARGRVWKTTDPLNNVTENHYDDLSRLDRVTAPDGGETQYEYSLAGKTTAVVDPTGARTEATWDYLGRQLTSTTIVRQPALQTHTTTFEYWPSGALQEVTPDGRNGTVYHYNAVGETTLVIDPAGNEHATTYDLAGRAVRTILPDGSGTRVIYDGAGRPVTTQTLDTGGTTVLATSSVVYDRAGNTLSTTDPRGHTTQFTHDPRGAVTEITEPVSATGSITSSYGYDLTGALTRFTNGRGQQFWTTYNTWGLLESRIEPATTAHPALADRTFTTVYDAAGRAVTELQPGGVSIANTYDVMGRLRTSTGAGAEVPTVGREFEYDLAGRMIEVTGSASANTLTWDDRGLLTSVTGPSGNSTYGYTVDGLLETRVDAAGTTSYGYDPAGRLSRAENTGAGVDVSIAYNSLSQYETLTFSDGSEERYRYFGYDARHRLETDVVALGPPSTTELGRITYGYDANGNITSKNTEGFAGAAENTYTYDWASRLVSWLADDGASSVLTEYEYDEAGNRTRKGETTFTYDERNRLTSGGGNTYMYTARGTRHYQITATETLTTYTDAFGQVTRQDAPGGHSDYTYDGLGRLLQAGHAYTGLDNDLASDGTTLYTRGLAGELIGAAAGTEHRLVWTDQHTDVVGQFTPAGSTLAGSATYDPLGGILVTAGMIGTLGYQSEYTDGLTGRVNMHARWYNPDTGQFDHRDTIPQSPIPVSINANGYGYANANPLSNVDPSGHILMEGNDVAPGSKVVTLSGQRALVGPATADKIDRKQTPPPPPPLSPRVQERKNTPPRTGCNQYDNAYAREACVRATTPVPKPSANVTNYRDSISASEVDLAQNESDPAEQYRVGNCYVFAYGFQQCTPIPYIQVGPLLLDNTLNNMELRSQFREAMTKGTYDTIQEQINVLLFVCNYWLRRCDSDTREILKQLSNFGSMNGHELLDILGFVPVLGEVADGANAIWYAAEGEWVDAGLSAVGVIPWVGWVGPVIRLVKRVPAGAADGASDLAKGACSFDSDTGVLMADGTSKPISDIEPGDTVLATDPETGSTSAEPVTSRWGHEDTLYELELADGARVTTTEDHPFWNATDREWQQAQNLDAGDQLRTSTGTTATVGIFDWSAVRSDKAYNLTVANTHTYYVLAGDTPVLVHNAGCPRRFMVDSRGTTVELVPPGVANLSNGAHMTTSDALDTAIEFLGPGYRDMGGGRFLSQDGLRQVRMTDADLAHPRQNPHINFETYSQPTGPGVRSGQPASDIHVYLVEETGWHT